MVLSDEFQNKSKLPPALSITNLPSIFLFSLKLYDGCGSLIEDWTLKDACISAVNVETYSAEEEYVELTIKYKQTEYINHFNYGLAPTPSTLTPSINTSKHNMGIGMIGSPDIVFK